MADEATTTAQDKPDRTFLTPNQPHNLDIIMLPAVRIEGRLVARNGKPTNLRKVTAHFTAGSAKALKQLVLTHAGHAVELYEWNSGGMTGIRTTRHGTAFRRRKPRRSLGPDAPEMPVMASFWSQDAASADAPSRSYISLTTTGRPASSTPARSDAGKRSDFAGANDEDQA